MYICFKLQYPAYLAVPQSTPHSISPRLMKLRLLIPLMLCLAACDKDDQPEPQSPINYHFSDGFESETGEIAEILPIDGSRWNSLEFSGGEAGSNEVTLCDTLSRSGVRSLRIFAQPSGNVGSKACIEKRGFEAPEGSKVVIEASIYINTIDTLRDLTLINLESCDCWDPNVPGNNCPGIRLMLSGTSNTLSIDREKILCAPIASSSSNFPRKQWVRIRWEMVLAGDAPGMNKVMINGQQAMLAAGANLPSASIFAQAAADNGIDFILQTPVYYERVQIGATANPGDRSVELFVDDFQISITR